MYARDGLGGKMKQALQSGSCFRLDALTIVFSDNRSFGVVCRRSLGNRANELYLFDVYVQLQVFF